MEPCYGYIVERVVRDEQRRTSFQGMLCVEGISPCMKPPFVLCGIQVAKVQPEEADIDQYLKGIAKLRMILRCVVMDCCGRKETGTAKICLELCIKTCGEENIRYGAQAAIDSAIYCSGTAFQVCASLCFHIIASRSEVIGRKKHDCSICAMPPLYPQPCSDTCGCRKRFF